MSLANAGSTLVKVRLSTVERGKKFLHRGKTYTMLSSGPQKDKNTNSTFRWVELDNGKKVKFTVNGATKVSLVIPRRRPDGREGQPAPTRSRIKVVPRSQRENGPVNAQAAPQSSVASNVYRVKAKWWSKRDSKYVNREFRIEAPTAAAAIQEVESARKNKSTKVSFTVARMSE